ncbi:MAG TPA: phosphoglucosamine mutase [Limnochordia bacterium]|nr:phosphoglucosamine mutase [Limnochordia bacterium]
MGRYFGTDGVRGVANSELTPELALRIGRAAALRLREKSQGPIIIGRDTRLSGQMLESAVVAGVTSTGLDAFLVGIIPTPGVAFLTKALGCAGGIVISASHNPLEDNGIKVFGPDGYKLSEAEEEEIEELIAADDGPRPIAEAVGRVIPKPETAGLYLEYLKEQVSLDLRGLHVALDCANGATSAYAAQLFSSLGAKVTAYYDQPNGTNINHFCGSTYPEKIQNLTREAGADLGFAFDGDGDRILVVDEQGGFIDGDQILAIIGLYLLKQGRLPAGKVVATAYSNGGLRKAFLESGGDVVYAKPGDRYVLETMLELGSILGGEQSGHIIFLENSTTGDGMLTALKLLETRAIQGKPLAELAACMSIFPQQLVNVRVENKNGWQDNARIQEAINLAQEKLAPFGRLFVRASGTEPVIRVMGEHPDQATLQAVLEPVITVIEQEQGGSRAS